MTDKVSGESITYKQVLEDVQTRIVSASEHGINYSYSTSHVHLVYTLFLMVTLSSETIDIRTRYLMNER